MVKEKNIPKLRFPEFKGEWEKKKLGEVSEINPSNKKLPDIFIYIDLDSVEKGELIKENSIYKSEAPSRAQRVLKTNDILFQMVRPYQMNNLYFDKDGNYVASTGYAQIRAKQNSMFIYQQLHIKKFVDEVIQKCTGTSYPALNSTDLSNIYINIPTLTEQILIASFFTNIDKKITELKRKKNLLEQYKKGIIEKIFSQELRFKDEKGKEFPRWEEKILGDVADVRDGTHESPKYYSYGYPFITSKNLLKDGNIDFDNINFICEKDYNNFNKRSKVELNDIIFGMIGTIGNPVLVKTIGFAIKNVALIKQKVELLNIFLIHYLDSPSMIHQFFEHNRGGTQKFLSLNIIRNLNVCIPCLKEQTKIANFLSAIDKKIKNTQTQIEKVEMWKKGLLQKMFC